MADDITVRSLAETEITPSELAQLFNTAFGEYEGVIFFTPETMAWYLARPGLGREHTFVALGGPPPSPPPRGGAWGGSADGSRLVGGIMVTTTQIVLGGEPVACGIVDSVMTLPTWRQRGIATRLMKHALAWMGDAGLDASLLYTARNSNGHRIYARLGYVEHAAVSYYFSAPAPPQPPNIGGGRGGRPHLRAAVPGEEEQVRDLLNACLGQSDGFVPVDPALWRWRREDRPHDLPCSVFVIEEGGEVRATGALCTTRVQLDGRPLDLVLMTDVAGAGPEMRERMVRALLRRVPPGYGAGILAGSYDPVLPALAEKLGMSCQDEVAMVAPFRPRAEEALRRRPTGWYTLSESLVGV